MPNYISNEKEDEPTFFKKAEIKPGIVGAGKFVHSYCLEVSLCLKAKLLSLHYYCI